MHTRGMTIQQAIEHTRDELRQNIERFEETAAALLNEVEMKLPQLTGKLEDYIEGCRFNQTAVLLWRLVV